MQPHCTPVGVGLTAVSVCTCLSVYNAQHMRSHQYALASSRALRRDWHAPRGHLGFILNHRALKDAQWYTLFVVLFSKTLYLRKDLSEEVPRPFPHLSLHRFIIIIYYLTMPCSGITGGKAFVNGKFTAFISSFHPKGFTVCASHLPIHSPVQAPIHSPTAVSTIRGNSLFVGSSLGLGVLHVDTQGAKGIKPATFRWPDNRSYRWCHP